tara:strand:+ start:3279 stop:3986 length:708 start_codon:yes stop_codon:yes gene_type:complete
MKSLNQFETKKLHYNKYLYKLDLCNILAPYFRSDYQKDKKLSYVKIKLDELNLSYMNGEILNKYIFRTCIEITNDDFLDAKDVYSILKNKEDYTIRVEGPTGLSIFTNDRVLILQIRNKMRNAIKGIWEPKFENVDILEKNVRIVSQETNFNYQVHFKNPANVDINFANWLLANTDKTKVGKSTLLSIQQGKVYGSYLYVNNEKVLLIVQMLAGAAIQRIDKLVFIEDKYKYDSQ